ncbi:hypothetical protein LTR86_001857 [Recurvomyces mirabilis]|nr:hypothetical protein LTR86_001857 [Recurvomyces mirabilis]
MEGTTTSAQITSRLGNPSAKAVHAKLNGERERLGLTEKPMATGNTWFADELERALSWTASMSYAKIAEKMGRPNVSTVQRRLASEPERRKGGTDPSRWDTTNYRTFGGMFGTGPGM